MWVGGRCAIILVSIAVVTGALYIMEFLLKRVSQLLARHERLKCLNLLLETLAHAFTGAVFWIVSSVGIPEPKSLRFMIESTLFSAVTAVIVDIDHFVATGSFSIEAARSLHGRPFLHWSGCLVALVVVLLVSSFMVQRHWSTVPCLVRQMVGSGWVTLVAWSSHQLRDSLRRGLWLWPPPRPLLSPPTYLHTPPLPLPLVYPLALASILTLLHITPLKLCDSANLLPHLSFRGKNIMSVV